MGESIVSDRNEVYGKKLMNVKKSEFIYKKL